VKELAEKPTRKKRCPHCSRYIYVRQGELLTEEQALDRDLVCRWLDVVERYGGSERVFAEERKKLSKQFGAEASANDTLWRMLNALASRQRDPSDLEQFYLPMGDFVKDEGKDPAPYIRQAMTLKQDIIRKQLLGHKRDSGGRSQVRVMTCNDDHVCDACRAASRHTYEIDTFLKQMPIPGSCTSPGGCRCWIGVHFART
jgi:hypothetical protein